MSRARQEERDPGHGKMSRTSGTRTAQKLEWEHKESVTGIPHITGQQQKSFTSQQQESFALRVSNRNPSATGTHYPTGQEQETHVSCRSPLHYESATGILHTTGEKLESFTLRASNGNPLCYGQQEK